MVSCPRDCPITGPETAPPIGMENISLGKLIFGHQGTG